MTGPARWDEATWPELKEALGGGIVAVLPVGATEPHGPHLPLSADVVIAEEMARRGAARVEARGTPCLLLPSVAYAITDWSAGFPGALSLSPATAQSLVKEICLGAMSAGAARVAIANAHLEPEHVVSLREACREVERESGVAPVFPDVTRRRLAGRLGEAFLAGDHAGRYETSLLLAARPALVREEVRRGLPAVPVRLVDRIAAGDRSFRAAGLDRAYCGDPAAASAGEGERLFEILAELFEEDLLEALAGRRP